MKSDSWIKTIALNPFLYPRATAFKAKDLPVDPVVTDAALPISLSMLATLTRLVQFLDKNHLKEAGLYSKPGAILECKELLHLCQCHQVPDLTVYSPHSIATVLKEILGELYEPLIPANISHQFIKIVSTGHKVPDEAVTETFKQIRFSTREFLQVFLGHLHRAATSKSRRVNVTTFAMDVGIALVRPPGDKITLNSKTMVQDRICVAELFILKALTLPYDCPTEMNTPVFHEITFASTNDVDLTKQLHFVQVTWDGGELTFTTKQIREMFSKFGRIKYLENNDQGSRAIVAYANEAEAEAAERASKPSIRVRRRKPRLGERSIVSLNDTVKDNCLSAVTPTLVKSASSQDMLRSESQENLESLPTLESTVTRPAKRMTGKLADDFIVVKDIEDEKTNVLSQTKSATSFELNQDSKKNEDRIAALIAKHHFDKQVLNEPISSEKFINNPQVKHLRRDTPIQNLAGGVEEAGEKKITNISERQCIVQKVLDRPLLNPIESTANSFFDAEDVVQHDSTIPPYSTKNCDEPLVEHSNIVAKTLSESIASNELETIQKLGRGPNENFDQLKLTGQAFQTRAYFVESMASSHKQDDAIQAISSNSMILVEELQSRLLKMEMILLTTTSALSATKQVNEFERAIFQLHNQILEIVAECLVLAGPGHGQIPDKSMSTTNAEFMDFLEAQSNTKVKILEVELRACQELHRLNKSQNERDRVSMEEELTTLRVGRMEIERENSELSTALRKCRSELACHVANATNIQRQKSVLKEKLTISDTKLHTTEVALAKLQSDYDRMHHVAAEAQMRAEKLKEERLDEERSSLDNQDDHKAEVDKVSIGVRIDEELPYTSKLFTKLSKLSECKTVGMEPASWSRAKLDSFTIAAQSSDVAAVEAMERKFSRDVHEQLATTRTALRETEMCSSDGQTLEEDEEELKQLQQQLASRSRGLDVAMNESRAELKKLLNPAAIYTCCDDRGVGLDEIKSVKESTIFDSTALVNELIARAEKTHSCTIIQFEDDGVSSYPTMPSSVACDQFALYPRDYQSVFYKNWTIDRSRRMADFSSYRDQHAVLQAKQSMQAFQRALAAACEKPVSK